MIRNPFFYLRHKIYCIFFCLFILLTSAQAAVTVDNSSSQGASETLVGLTTLSWSHTVNNCSNCVLYVAISTFTQTNVPSARVQNITFGAQNLTVVGTRVSPVPNLPSTGNSSVELFRLNSPVAGTSTITVNFFIPVNYAVGGANSFNGVSQTNPNSTFFSNSGNSAAATVNASDSVTGDLVLDVLGTTPNAIFAAPNASQTERYNGRQFFGFSFDVGAGSTKSPTSISTPMSWNLTNSSVWALGAITIKQFVNTPSAASISGQIRTAEHQAITSSIVVLQNLNTGEEFFTQPDEKGRYFFDGLPISHIYRVGVSSRRYDFTTSEQILSLTEAVENLDFVGVSRKSNRTVGGRSY